MKECSVCKSIKQFSEFSAKRGGYASKCKSCHNEYVRNVWYPANKDKHKESVSSYKKRNPNRVISSRYGIDETIVEEIMSPGRCGICSSTENLVFDHIHETNTARGCLCFSCNTMLGRLGDTNEEILSRIESVQKYISATKYQSGH